MGENQYSLKLKETIYKGSLNCYQARTGQVFIVFGSIPMGLTKHQSERLPIDLYDLEDFNNDLYNKFYHE